MQDSSQGIAMDTASLAAEFSNQKSIYDFLARLFLSPLTQEEVDGILGAGFDSLDSGSPSSFDEGLSDMAKELHELGDEARLALNVDYTAAFYGITQYDGRVATPFESVFRGEDGVLYGQPRGEVYAELKKECLKLREGLDIPEDHLSFELQFLGILCQRAAQAFGSGDEQAALANLAKQRDFISNHILSWIDELSEIASSILKLRFYQVALSATKAFVQSNLSLIDAVLDTEAAPC